MTIIDSNQTKYDLHFFYSLLIFGCDVILVLLDFRYMMIKLPSPDTKNYF